MRASRRTYLWIASLGLVASGLVAAAPLQDHKGEKDTELEKHMEAMDDRLAALKKTVKDAAQNAQSLKLVVEMEKEAILCKLETPKMTATLPEGERAQFVLEFRKQVIDLEHRLRDLEVALLDHDQTKAAQLYKAIEDLKDAGHEKFTKD